MTEAVHTSLVPEEVKQVVALPDDAARAESGQDRARERASRREEKRKERDLKKAIKAFFNAK